MKDLILFELVRSLFRPSEEDKESIKFARKTHPFLWGVAFISLSLMGVVQLFLWLLTIIPTLINRWLLKW